MKLCVQRKTKMGEYAQVIIEYVEVSVNDNFEFLLK